MNKNQIGRNNNSLISVRESVRSMTFDFLLKQDVETRLLTEADEPDLADEIGVEFTTILTNLKKMGNLVATAEKFPATNKLILAAIKNSTSLLASPEDSKSIEAYGRISTFLGAFSFLLASMSKVAKESSDNVDQPLNKIIKDDILKIIQTKFQPSKAWWTRTGSIAKWYGERSQAGAAVAGTAQEGVRRNISLVEAMYSDNDVLNEGFFDFLKSFFTSAAPPTAATAVKNLYKLFNGDISKAINDDMSSDNFKGSDLVNLVKTQTPFMKQFVSGGTKLPEAVANAPEPAAAPAKGTEEKGAEAKGTEEKGAETKGTEAKGTEEKGAEEKAPEDKKSLSSILFKNKNPDDPSAGAVMNDTEPGSAGSNISMSLDNLVDPAIKGSWPSVKAKPNSSNRQAFTKEIGKLNASLDATKLESVKNNDSLIMERWYKLAGLENNK